MTRTNWPALWAAIAAGIIAAALGTVLGQLALLSGRAPRSER